jgi:preprotein translocase subunit SecG
MLETITPYLPHIQIVLSVFLIVSVLLQQSAAGLGGAFGDNFSSGFHTRRGSEKTLFNVTVVLSFLFAVSAILSIIAK